MSKSTMSGPVRAGYINNTSDASIGYVRLSRAFTNYPGYPEVPAGTNPNATAYRIAFAPTAVVERTIQLPPNAQITGFEVDLLTAWDAAGAVTLTIGITSGGTEYVSGVNMKSTAGRLTPTYTGTQLANMSNIGTNITLYATITTASGTNTAGAAIIVCNYIQY